MNPNSGLQRTRISVVAGIAVVTMMAAGLPARSDNSPPPSETPFDLKTMSINGQEVSYHSFRDPNAGLLWLNARLQEFKVAGSLLSCTSLVEVPVTRYEEGFGGFCRLKDGGREETVKVCADTGVGNFRLLPSGNGPVTPEAAVEFVAGNCAGG